MKKKHNFFYYCHNQKKQMNVHFKKKHYITQNVICLPPCATKWNETEPHLVMEGFAESIIVGENNIVII